jgi:hypothetical protein
MSNAKRDDNYVPTLLGVSIDDLSTPTPLAVNPDNNKLLIQPPLAPNISFDYFSATNSGVDEDTIVYKSGGVAGVPVLTMVVTYATGAEKISDSITSIEYS